MGKYLWRLFAPLRTAFRNVDGHVAVAGKTGDRTILS